MLDDTPVQFEPEARSEAGIDLKECPLCGTRFSGDARFCPFDGEALGEARTSVVDALIGTLVDERYEVEAVLGEGGMGTVYRVRHRVLGKLLALKVLRADLARESELGERFLREARAAASVAHPSVVQITDFGTLPSGQPYFVMELLSGEPLSVVLRRGGPLPAARAVRILGQIVDALSSAHAAGVVHRDLKPDNIHVAPGPGGIDAVKVLDFGLAKVAGQSRLTKAGLVFGTPHYMSPEQASGGTVDERTDVYALGVVMYEMLTGRVPFEADTYMGVLTKHLYVEPTPPSVLLGGTAELGALEQVMLRCLEKKSERRYRSMAALAEELRGIIRWNAAGALTVEPARPGDPREIHRLADELEVPEAIELEMAVRRERRERGSFGPAGVAVGMGVVAGATVLGVLWWRSVAEPPRVPPPGPKAELVRPPSEPAPLPSLERAPEVTDEGRAASVPAAPSDAELAPKTSTRRGAAASSGAPAHPRAGPHKPSTSKHKMVGSDIVNPWSD